MSRDMMNSPSTEHYYMANKCASMQSDLSFHCLHEVTTQIVEAIILTNYLC